MNLGRTVVLATYFPLARPRVSPLRGPLHGDRRPRGFSCWGQFLCMAFAQLTYRESPRDIEAARKVARFRNCFSILRWAIPVSARQNRHTRIGSF